VASPEIYRTLPVIERTGRSSGPPDRSRSVTRGRNESPIFRETEEGGERGRERCRAQCGSLTRLLITIVPRTDNELNRQKKWPVAAADINLRCQKQCNAICETEKGGGGEFAYAPSMLIAPSSRLALLRLSAPRRRSESLLSSALGLFVSLSSALPRTKGESARGRAKRARGGQEDGRTGNIAGDQFWRADKKCASGRARGSSFSSFFLSPLIFPPPPARPLAESDSERNVALWSNRLRILKIVCFAESASLKLRVTAIIRGGGGGEGRKENDQEIQTRCRRAIVTRCVDSAEYSILLASRWHHNRGAPRTQVSEILFRLK